MRLCSLSILGVILGGQFVGHSGSSGSGLNALGLFVFSGFAEEGGEVHNLALSLEVTARMPASRPLERPTSCTAEPIWPFG